MSLINNFLKLDAESPIKVAVVGDSVLDQYFQIKVKRISPEFPIPTYLSENDDCLNLPGGASNVVYQAKNFNSEAKLVSFVDKEARDVFESHGIDTSLCVEIPNNIPRKRRFYAEDFPTYRWDVEKAKYGLSPEELKKYSNILYNNVLNNEFDAVIYSDYDKGVFDDWPGIVYTHQFNTKVCTIVDPKNSFKKWNGCTIFKPNKSEAISLSGQDSIENAAWFFVQELGCRCIITNGNNPVTVLSDSERSIQKIGKTIVNPAKSVVGGGDAFSCFLAMAFARGFNTEESAEIAWLAGTKYVQNRYNKPLYPVDLLESKIITNPEILRNRDFKLVFTNGCFDFGLTKGHIESLKFAKQQGDKLVVALNSDQSIKNIKGENRPIMSLGERMEIVSALEYVDFVVSFDENTPYELIKKISPNLIVKGGNDYKTEDVVGKDICDVLISPYFNSISTTDKINEYMKF